MSQLLNQLPDDANDYVRAKAHVRLNHRRHLANAKIIDAQMPLPIPLVRKLS
jgi:hypothetical protein